MISTYEGEEIIEKIVIRGGEKHFERKYIPRTVFHDPKDKPAFILGNAPSRSKIDISKLKEHGFTYGCNALYRDFIPDYLFMVDRFISQKIVDDKVFEKCICYAPALEFNRSKRRLHLIPHNPHWISGSAAFWTACMHGHKNIYLVGFDFREYGKDQLNNIYQDTDNYGPRHSDTIFEPWLQQYRSICKRRPYCKFTVVHDNPPDYVQVIPFENHSVMSYADFIGKVLNQQT